MRPIFAWTTLPGPAFGNTGHAMALEAGVKLVGATTPPANPLKRACGPF